jgi:hypothetical protein
MAASRKYPRGYKIYVRTPTDEVDAVEVRRFLKEFAELLSDPEKHLVVEPYDDYVERSAKPTGKGGDKLASEPIPSGGPGSPLTPFYVCTIKRVQPPDPPPR